MKLCPECAASVPLRKVGQRGPPATFCCHAHKVVFQNRHAVQGRAVIALAKAWRVSRNRKEDREVGRKALSELCSVLDQFIAEDREAGRPRPTFYAETLMANGQYQDRMKGR